jgi:hypothetical protein
VATREVIVKDSLALLAGGVVCSGIAWVFWHYSGENGAAILLALVTAMLVVDNIKLRRELRRRDEVSGRPAGRDRTVPADRQ